MSPYKLSVIDDGNAEARNLQLPHPLRQPQGHGFRRDHGRQQTVFDLMDSNVDG